MIMYPGIVILTSWLYKGMLIHWSVYLIHWSVSKHDVFYFGTQKFDNPMYL